MKQKVVSVPFQFSGILPCNLVNTKNILAEYLDLSLTPSRIYDFLNKLSLNVLTSGPL